MKHFYHGCCKILRIILTVTSMLASIEYLFYIIKDLSGSWYEEWFSTATWKFLYHALRLWILFKSYVLFGIPWHWSDIITKWRSPGSSLGLPWQPKQEFLMTSGCVRDFGSQCGFLRHWAETGFITTGQWQKPSVSTKSLLL